MAPTMRRLFMLMAATLWAGVAVSLQRLTAEGKNLAAVADGDPLADSWFQIPMKPALEGKPTKTETNDDKQRKKGEKKEKEQQAAKEDAKEGKGEAALDLRLRNQEKLDPAATDAPIDEKNTPLSEEEDDNTAPPVPKPPYTIEQSVEPNYRRHLVKPHLEDLKETKPAKAAEGNRHGGVAGPLKLVGGIVEAIDVTKQKKPCCDKEAKEPAKKQDAGEGAEHAPRANPVQAEGSDAPPPKQAAETLADQAAKNYQNLQQQLQALPPQGDEREAAAALHPDVEAAVKKVVQSELAKLTGLGGGAALDQSESFDNQSGDTAEGSMQQQMAQQQMLAIMNSAGGASMEGMEGGIGGGMGNMESA